jgi:hypothetical protein
LQEQRSQEKYRVDNHRKLLETISVYHWRKLTSDVALPALDLAHGRPLPVRH